MADRIGQQLGNYRLVRLLGEGGFAEVYLGEHIYLNTQAAIKLLHMHMAQDDISQFQQEARMLADLTHPRIVRVLDFGVENHTPYLVMDYAPGGSLRTRHPKGSRLPLLTVVEYVQQVAQALQYAHDRKLVHRDVKPPNMLIDRRDELVLSDFGIASIAHSTSSMSHQAASGTPPYMAPEQIMGQPRPASDQYALAVVAYEWLTGTYPFTGTMVEIWAKHLHMAPPSLRQYLPALAPVAEQVILTALAKEPKQRFPSVRAFATALADACQEQSSRSTSVAPPIKQVAPPAYSTAPGLSTIATKTGATPDQSSVPAAFVQPSPHQTTPSTAAPVQNSPSPLASLSSAQRAALPSTPLPLPPAPPDASQRLSRRKLLLGTAGLAVLGAAGAGGVWFTHQQSSRPPSRASTPPLPNSSGSMYGADLQHTHYYSAEHILSPGNITYLKTAWTVTTGNYIASSAVVAKGVVYVYSQDHKLYAINADSGKILWTWATPLADLLNYDAANGGSISSPAVANGAIYIGAIDHKLYAIDATSGKVLWTVLTGDQIQASSPAVANGVVYISSMDQKLYAINALSGKVLWSTPLQGGAGWFPPAIAYGKVYITVNNNVNQLYAVDAATGHILWNVPNVSNAPAIANRTIYILGNGLLAIDAINGQALWTAPTNGYQDALTIANGLIYLGTQNGNTLYALESTSPGRTLWSTQFESTGTSLPVIANGMLYVGSNDHKLYAFHLSQ